MSNEKYWDEDDDDDTEDTPRGDGQSSEAMKALRRKAKADAKTIAELNERLDGLSKSQREAVVKDVLEKKGVNPKTARLILKDMDDINEDSVNAWLDDNAELLSFTKAPEKTQDELANEAAYGAQDGLTHGADEPGSGNRHSDAIDKASTRAEFEAAIAAAQ